MAGRLDMIVLHLMLLLRQLSKVSGATMPIGQQVFDRFCRDMDDNFREMGVGDLAVPKAMWRVAEDFYGRAKVYESALAEDNDNALVAAVSRNVFGVAEPPLGARRLAAYMREAARQISQRDTNKLVRAELVFPDPEKVAPPSFLVRPKQ